MKARAASFPVLIVLSIILVILAPRYSHAGTPFGTLCFEDSFGDAWFLDFGSFSSGLNFDVHGFMIGADQCNGTFVQPVSGTATRDGQNLVVGVWSIATSQECFSVSWNAVVDLSTFQGNGWFMTQLVTDTEGNEGAFSISEISCSDVIESAKSKSQTLKDPSRRLAK